MRIALTSPPPRPHDRDDDLAWLRALRWIATFAQLLLVLAAWALLDLPFAYPTLLLLLLLPAATNLVWALRVRRERTANSPARAPSQHHLAGAALLFDTTVLTALLSQSGGPINPFTVFYLVHVALAAALLDGPWALVLTLYSSAAFGLLFVITPEASMHVLHHGDGFLVHLRGMWLAYGLAAAATSVFVVRQARALRERERELLRLREHTARAEHLSALHTLAAGAAHELGTPLGTIALIASELDAERDTLAPSQRDDVALLQTQVARCQAILQRMAADAGQPRAEAPQALALGALATHAAQAFPGAALEVQADAAEQFFGPRDALQQALGNLVKNALDAQPAQGPVQLQLHRTQGWLEARVIDRGPGIARAQLERLGEPFFTTKAPGQGTGLGLFLTRTVAEALGGSLHIDSEPGRGTTATLRLPWESPA